MKKKTILYFEGIAILVGTIIGAGVLGIPYAISQAGFLTGIITLVGVAIAITFLNLFVGEIILRTKGTHQMPGYAKLYLGKWGRDAMAVSMIIGIFGALTAYIIGQGVSLSALFGGTPFMWSIVFAVFGGYLLYRGLTVIKTFELVMMGIIIIVVLIISSFSSVHVEVNNLAVFDITKIFLPYGVILFAFTGASAIRSVREVLKRHENKMKSVIIASSFIPLVIYFIFAFVVIGVTGGNTTEVATVGLGSVIGKEMIIFGNIFAIFAMGTSFLTLGLASKQVFEYDYKLSKHIAWAVTIGVPLLLFVAGVQDFIKTIGFVGAFVGGLQGILLVIIYWISQKKGKRKPEYDLPIHWVLGSVLIFMFVGGMIATVISK